MSLRIWSAFCTLGSLVEAKWAVGHAAETGGGIDCAGVAGVWARTDAASRRKKPNIAALRMSSKAVSKCLGLLYAIVNTFWRWPLACEQPQILRLRARPTRKRSGSESLCGRFAQDDILKFMNNPGSGPHYPRYNHS